MIQQKTFECMKIHITKANKSIPILDDFYLPGLTVLTGPNGSGKSHLFEVISNRQMCDVVYQNRKLETIRYIKFNQLNPSIDNECDPIMINQKVKEIWTNLSDVQKRLINTPRVKEELIPENNPMYPHLQPENIRLIVSKISRQSKVSIGLITEDILGEYLPYLGMSGNELFNSQFATIFKAYQIHKLDNTLNKVYNEQGTPTEYLEEEEYLLKYGEPPWDYINRILEKIKLPYEVTNPDRTRRESTFKFELIHKEKGFKITSNDLSTGEKTLMSLALAIYNSIHDFNKIDLLVLDEPDASLHPSMSKMMIEILKDDIYGKQNIPVLISTHSPTTIACSPTQSLYKISKDKKVPESCSLDDSMDILAYEIPNIKLSIDSRRQIFVEHIYDVLYYEKLFQILTKSYEIPTSLQFLPPHNHDGTNCSDVIDITRSLAMRGNTSIYGLIDYDGKNRTEDKIIVLGNGNRYAIENYIFEPHILGLYLIKKVFMNLEEFQIRDIHNYSQLCNKLDQELVQKIASVVSEKLFQPGEIKKSKLINDYDINTPEELFYYQGHELEEKIKSTWPILNSIRGKGDSSLKLDIINITINDFPDYLSKDILWTFMQFK
jgi:predicted ATPase